MKNRLLGTVIAGILFVPTLLQGQTPVTPPRVLSLPASARAMALGGAYMMNAGHADALFHHPALLARASGFGLEVQSWGGDATSSAASAAMAWLGGGVGVGLQTFQAGLTDVAARDQDALFTTGPVPTSERVATLGYARSVFGVLVGVAGKFVEERVGGASSSTVLMDVGAAHDLGPVTVGVTVQDIGNDPFQVDGGFTPARVVLGAGAYGQQVGPLDMGLTTAVTYSESETLVGGGLEFGYWPISGRTFVARVGLQSTPEGSDASPATFGFAFWGDDLVLEWAYRGFGETDAGTHRFGVRWR